MLIGIPPLLSPDAADTADRRPVFDARKVIDQRRCLYLGLDALVDPVAAAAIGAIVLADLAQVAGEVFNDRSGAPQIYRLTLSAGEKPRRLTFGSGYAARPRLSPDGRLLAMVTLVTKALSPFVITRPSTAIRLMPAATALVYLSAFFSSSTPAPRLPMTMPGRAVKTLTLTLFAIRSISIFEIPAWCSFPLMNFRS